MDFFSKNVIIRENHHIEGIFHEKEQDFLISYRQQKRKL
jgi:hypothetical protein